jgi:broad specificity phosphatase PhoE
VNLFALRHGETEWSLSGKHTGTTDVPLTDHGRRLAERMRPVLGRNFSGLALCSPMQRARETCELAGFGQNMVVDPDLAEWNYGEYEGMRPEEIHKVAPGWLIFRDGCPGGETPEQVCVRVDRVIARTRALDRDTYCAATDTCCACLPRAGLGCRRLAASTFCWIPAPCASLAAIAMYRL